MENKGKLARDCFLGFGLIILIIWIMGWLSKL